MGMGNGMGGGKQQQQHPVFTNVTGIHSAMKYVCVTAVPPKVASSIIGKNGVEVAYLEADTGARIGIDRIDEWILYSEQRRVVISANSVESVVKAYCLMISKYLDV